MLQTPPPPLPVPAPANIPSTPISNTNIKSEDIYDPLKAEEDEEEETEQKPINQTLNIKKEITIKIEPSMSLTHLLLRNIYILSLDHQFLSKTSTRKYCSNVK